MTSQQYKPQNHSIIAHRRCSAPTVNLTNIMLVSTPKMQRTEDNRLFVESTFNCFKNQVSGLTLFCSPQKCATTKEIKLETVGSARYIDKGRRVTLPLQKTDSVDGSQKCLPGSPPKQPKTQIKIIYQNNLQGSQASYMRSNNGDSRVFLFHQKTEVSLSKQKIVEYKINRNKLCSAVFSVFYEPLSSIRRKSQELQQLLKQLRRQADLLSSKVSSSCELTKECKTSAAETTTSAMAGVKQSQMSLDSSRWSQSNSKCNFQAGFNLYRPSLADKIPSSKHLGKTIILNSNSYDFGGLMIPNRQQIQQSQVQGKSIVRQGFPREWDQLKGLLSENSEQNMKESIHCGPDVRANSFNCQMLQSFGRSIKQSTVSYNE